MNRQAFILRLNERLETSLSDNVIGIGWSKADNLHNLKEWAPFKAAILNAYPEPYPDGYQNNERALGNVAGSVWRFLVEMQTGDWVVVPAEDGFYVAEISGNAFFDQLHRDEDYAWRRPVKWLTSHAKPRSYASNPLQRRLKARQTCVYATDLLEDIDSSLRGDKPLDVPSIVLKNAYKAVADALHNAINDVGLEKLVERLAASTGAAAAVLPKNSGEPGDADVLATYDLGIGHSNEVIEVAYQVKQHEAESDEEGILQLLQRMEARPSIVRGCFVTTASTISEEAKHMADENNIIVLTEKEIVEWILRAGLGAIS